MLQHRILHGLAVVAGALILAAVAHVTVMSTGGYGTQHCYLTLAVAFGVFVSSICVGKAYSDRRYIICACFVACIIGGEAYGFIRTADRLVAASEKAQADVRGYAKLYSKAVERVTNARKAVDNPPATSQRLTKAEAAKARADQAVADNAAERGCRENCRQLLQDAVDKAASEVTAARAALEQDKQKAVQTAMTELGTATTVLAGMEAPVSPTPLADRTGWQQWVIDLVTAILGAIAANGLACCLVAFGAHRSTPRVEIVAVPVPPVPKQPAMHKSPTAVDAQVLQPASNGAELKQHAARFALACLQPGGEADLLAIRDEYPRWCPPGERRPDAEIGRALAALFTGASIDVVERDGRQVVVGVSLRPAGERAVLT